MKSGIGFGGGNIGFGGGNNRNTGGNYHLRLIFVVVKLPLEVVMLRTQVVITTYGCISWW